MRRMFRTKRQKEGVKRRAPIKSSEHRSPRGGVSLTTPTARERAQQASEFSMLSKGPVEQAGSKPFETYRHLPQFPLEAGNETINQAPVTSVFPTTAVTGHCGRFVRR